MVFLSYGIPFSPDGFAINDFESLNDGEITNLNLGVTTAGGLRWLDSVTFER